MPELSSTVTVTSFNWVDGALILFCALSALIGFFRGMTREVLSVAAWIAAIIGAIQGFQFVLPWVKQWVQHLLLAQLISGIGIFLILLTLFLLFSQMVSQSIKQSMLGGVDRSLGFVFGLIRGAFLICLGYVVASFVWAPEKHPESLKTAKSTPWIREGADQLKRLIPKDFLTSSSTLGRSLQHHLEEKEPAAFPSSSAMEQTVEALSTFKPRSGLAPSSQKKESAETKTF
ncbi:MAG: CvpA family protein [Alphaproteobacteria bacterium]